MSAQRDKRERPTGRSLAPTRVESAFVRALNANPRANPTYVHDNPADLRTELKRRGLL